jgi:hypothetical protein
MAVAPTMAMPTMLRWGLSQVPMSDRFAKSVVLLST